MTLSDLRAEAAMSDDPVCEVCGERKSAHVPTDEGPLTHPREARGEGTYEMRSHWEGFDFNRCEWARYETWRFVPAEKETT